jgi:hypothetical protein
MAAGSTYTPIATTTLGSAQTDFTFSSIPGTYTDLVIVYQAKAVSTSFDVKCQMNSDTGSNYSMTVLSGNGSVANSYRESNQVSMLLNNYGGVSSTEFNMTTLSVLNYSNTTTYKTVLYRSGKPSAGVDAGVGLWRSSSAISSIKLIGNQFATGSTFTLYGIAAA